MGGKVTFNEITRVIKVTQAPVLINGELVVELDVKVDLYGDQKEDWLSTPGLRTVRPPISVIGGQTTPTGRAGNTFFQKGDWKIEPYSADHIFRISGNLYSDDGLSPFIKAAGGPWDVQIERVVTNIVDTLTIGSGVTAQDKLDIANQSLTTLMTHIMESGETYAEALRLMRANAAGNIVVINEQTGEYELRAANGTTVRLRGIGAGNSRTGSLWDGN